MDGKLVDSESISLVGAEDANTSESIEVNIWTMACRSARQESVQSWKTPARITADSMPKKDEGEKSDVWSDRKGI
ncbi:hypothetical protein A8A04_05805 [Escherichia coli]|nr:hypothetical protein A8A04_05805 [Escherichia coli]